MKLAGIASKITSALKQARRDLDGIRDHIYALQSQRDKIEAMPDDIATIERRVDEAIKEAVAKNPFKYGGFNRSDVVPAFTIEGTFSRLAESGGIFRLLAALAPERTKELLLADVPRHGINDVDRAAQLSQLDRDIMGAEIAEEVCCREIDQATGTLAMRRADANPAILLAPDDEIGFG